ncbi:uncharacterized protein LOC132203797 [Neocloeon triangulifer]|uniref:uncharacterized protein LOC132203797 n=1 Tax=Neocloeon triangulifer TaxID=2078957 RepID=UPI00286F2D3B|nr:uncharacterized protein LOC132203797 [Neocloeon triangulifer]
MEALKVALLAVLALAIFVEFTSAGVINLKGNATEEEIHSRWRREPRITKGASKSISPKQAKLSKPRIEKTCMTKSLEVAQSCCFMPLIASRNAQGRCLKKHGINGKEMEGLFHTARAHIVTNYESGKFKIPRDDFATMSEHVLGDQVCFVECVLKDIKLIDDNGRPMETAFEMAFSSKLKSKIYNSNWDSTIKTAVRECVAESDNLPVPQMKNSKGQMCSTTPFTYMFCLRKKFTLNCPDLHPAPGCQKKAKADLEACNQKEVWQAISQGGPYPGSKMNNMPSGGGMNGIDTPQGQMPQPGQMPNDQMPQGESGMDPPPMEDPPSQPEEPAAEGGGEEAQPEPAAEPEMPAEEPPAEEPQAASEDEAPPPEEPPAEEPPAEEPPAEEE